MPGQDVHLPHHLDMGANPAPRPLAALTRVIEAQPRWVIWRLALAASLLFWGAVAIGIASLV